MRVSGLRRVGGWYLDILMVSMLGYVAVSMFNVGPYPTLSVAAILIIYRPSMAARSLAYFTCNMVQTNLPVGPVHLTQFG